MMKKFIAMVMVAAMILTMSVIALGEATPADFEALAKTKVFRTEGELKGTWTIGFERDENNRYPCVLDLGDGRTVVVPLTDEEVNSLMYKALEEYHEKVEAEAKAANPSFPARVIDWVTFWN